MDDPNNDVVPAFSLRLEGEVERPRAFTMADLAHLDADAQVADVRQLGAKRAGAGVRLSALLSAVGTRTTAQFIGLHATRDDFHASIPLVAVRDRAVVVYALEGKPLPVNGGGPFRFFIPDHLACRAHEIDECANVKFVDRIELTATKGVDNRPHDDAAHQALHAREKQG